MVAEELAIAGVAAAIILADDAEDDTGEYKPPEFKPDSWANSKDLASYNVDGGKVTLLSQSTPKGTLSHGVNRLAARTPQGLRFPDESNPGNLTRDPSGRTYQPDEIQQVADDWIAAIPPKGPTGPVGPQPGPQPGRPQLPGGGLVGVASSNFQIHTMYNPTTGESEVAEKQEDHDRLDAKGWVHEMPDLSRAGRYGDTEIVHVNEEEVEMLIQHGGAGTRNPTTGLREFYTPNTSTNIKNQIESYLDGEASCFDLVDGNSPNSPFQWVYSDGGNILQLDDDDFIGVFAGGNAKTSATIALRIAPGYSLQMVCKVESGFIGGTSDGGTADVFSESFLIPTSTGDLARFVMVAGDILQIDIDGWSGIGDFIITSEGIQITKSVSVDNDVVLTLELVSYNTDNQNQLELDDIIFKDAETASEAAKGQEKKDDDDDDDDEGDDGMSGLGTVLILSAVGLLAYFVFQNPVMSFRGGSNRAATL